MAGHERSCFQMLSPDTAIVKSPAQNIITNETHTSPYTRAIHSSEATASAEKAPPQSISPSSLNDGDVEDDSDGTNEGHNSVPVDSVLGVTHWKAQDNQRQASDEQGEHIRLHCANRNTGCMSSTGHPAFKKAALDLRSTEMLKARISRKNVESLSPADLYTSATTVREDPTAVALISSTQSQWRTGTSGGRIESLQVDVQVNENPLAASVSASRRQIEKGRPAR
ncbi:hypothetical protein F5Y06DRAFT_255911 [Hypoxylon sp. FL0890]|nr:hypothetical protein F5Y06DRAFT_255911 [Hypoxylon sp. FL0890]